jgi:hypothetical protein
VQSRLPYRPQVVVLSSIWVCGKSVLGKSCLVLESRVSWNDFGRLSCHVQPADSAAVSNPDAPFIPQISFT